MEHFHYDGEGSLEEPATENNLIKDYADKKAFTGCLLTAIVLMGLLLLCAIAYSVSLLILNIADLLIK